MIDEKLLIETMQWRMREAGTSDWNRCLDEVEMFIKEFPKVCEWIPVSERLPKPNKAVLICTNTGEIEVDYYGSCTKDFIGLKGTHMKAAAWQPLPEPYKAGEHG